MAAAEPPALADYFAKPLGAADLETGPSRLVVTTSRGFNRLFTVCRYDRSVAALGREANFAIILSRL